jgi:2-polyprenyl-3-methyl-5-hydroxy-6-metoxy-1,4-benzoquinol methylase
MHEVKIEDGLVVGNTYNKYESRNPIAQLLMAGFLRSLDRLVAASGASRITEVGCGEGHIARHLARNGIRVTASDVSQMIIGEARRLSAADGLDIDYHVADIYDLDPATHRNNLVVCCEVLEHLHEPERALEKLVSLADPFLLVSVPREPIWRILNLSGLRYVRELGNTPGHLNHWSRRQFLRLTSKYANVIEVESPLPWTMGLLRRR